MVVGKGYLCRAFVFAMAAVCTADDRPPLTASGKYQGAPKAGPVFETPEAAWRDVSGSLAVRALGGSEFAVGPVRFDKERRTLTIPATVNRTDLIVEYALVHTSGKTHEAIFATEATPAQVHLAALLLGVSNKLEAGWTTMDQGPRVRIEVAWDRNGPPARYALSDLVLVRDPDGAEGDGGPKPLAGDGWVYNGSVFDRWGFAAARDGSIVALIADGAALVNSLSPTRANDDAHVPNGKRLPRVGTPVRVEIALPSAAGGAP